MDVPPFWPVAIAWLLFFSTMGRSLLTVVVARVLCLGLRPGVYRRGGFNHVRVWAAERFLEIQRLDYIYGSPQAVLFHRLLGTKVGKDSILWHVPSVTGLVSIGENSSIGHEADLRGHIIEGDRFIVGDIVIEDDVRIGSRVFVGPNSRVRSGAEVVPGACVQGVVEGDLLWAGSPLVPIGRADESWPAEDPYSTREVSHLSRLGNWLAHFIAQLWLPLLSVLSVTPVLIFVLPKVHRLQRFEKVFPIFAMWVPVFVFLTMLTWVSLVALTLRLLAVFVRPGYYPQRSLVGVMMYLAHILMQRSLTSTYILYASAITPYVLRMFGAKVARNVEISTVETIPHLTSFGEGSFMADHSMVSATRYRCGWLHIGSSVIGERSFVGNSGIIGPDRDMAADSLVAVLSSLPEHPEAGTSWIGRPPTQIPRQRINAEDEATYRPPLRLKVARALVELCRLIPFMITAWLDLAIVYCLAVAYLRYGRGLSGIIGAVVWSGPVVLAAGIVAAYIPIIVKWLLVGRFTPSQHPLFSKFVWLGELSDAFNEMLAVPSLIRMSLGTPMFNVWLRLIGTKVGKNVWCETWWLPEFDLIQLDDNVTVNRGTVLQTHLFHDRVMSLERVHLEAGSTLGANSFILPGATIGSRSVVGPGSLIMRQETLPSDTRWAGNPVRLVKESSDA